jgi:hypothetical protein
VFSNYYETDHNYDVIKVRKTGILSSSIISLFGLIVHRRILENLGINHPFSSLYAKNLS